MGFFHADQRQVRDRCEEILARDVRRDTTRAELVQILRDVRLVPGTTPEGVARLLQWARDTGDPEVWRRSIARAIPRRGRLRPAAAIVGLAAAVGLAAGLVWISPWLLVATVVLLLAIGVLLLRRFLARHAEPVIHVGRMEEAAEKAQRDGDVPALNALYAEARRMIAEDHVPAGVGFRLANVLGAAAASTPFPVELLRDLRQLLLLAPETELTYAHVRDDIERRLRGRVDVLFGRIHRAVRGGESAVPLRAELRELARTAPGVTGARARQAEILKELASAAIDRDAAAPLDEILDEIEELIDQSPRELAGVLDDIVARATAPGTLQRAEALQARIDLLASSDQGRPQVVASYQEIREAAARGHARRQRDLVAAMRRTAAWAAEHGDAALLGELREDARALVARGRIPEGTGADLAGVLRECVRAEAIPTTLLDDYAALRALAPDVPAPRFWSIVDAALERLDARLRELGDRAQLVEIAARFDESAVRARDPEIVGRARKAAARARELTSPSP